MSAIGEGVLVETKEKEHPDLGSDADINNKNLDMVWFVYFLCLFLYSCCILDISLKLLRLINKVKITFLTVYVHDINEWST